MPLLIAVADHTNYPRWVQCLDSSTTAFPGTTYRIAVDGYDGASGIIELNVSLVRPPSGPPNDNFENRIQLFGASVTTTGTDIGATRQPGELLHAGQFGQNSVWWSWTAPASGVVSISTAGSDFDTLLAVYVGSSLLSLTPVASNDDAATFFGYPTDPTSRVSFAAKSGTTYQIAVDGYDGVFTSPLGTIHLSINLAASVPPPPNDNFANRISLNGANLTTTESNLGATKEAGEPNHAGNLGGRSVWWSWTAPASGSVSVSTLGSDFDTLLAVYLGTAASSLSLVASNDDDPSAGIANKASKVSFDVTAGTRYQIAVDGHAGASGSISLSLMMSNTISTEYFTGFESSEGYQAWQSLAGQNGWTSSYGSGGSRIVTNLFHGLGQQAYIGFSPITNGLMQVVRWVNAVTAGEQSLRFSVLMEVVDSTNGHRDDFEWIFGDKNGNLFFAVAFSNQNLETYFWLDDGSGWKSSGPFQRNIQYNLEILANPSENGWSAHLNGTGLVTNQPITTRSIAANIGYIAALWGLRTTNAPGDNYMVFDNFRLELITPVSAPAIIRQPQSQIVIEGTNVAMQTLTSGSPSASYQWFRNEMPLPGATNASLSWHDVTLGDAGVYRAVASNLMGSVTSQDAVLLVSPAVAAPANDDFASRIMLASVSNVVFGSNRGGTKEGNEPAHAGNIGGSSVWWSWTAPLSVTITMSTLGSGFDTLLAVYTGDSLASLTPIAMNDDAQTTTRGSLVQFDAVGGTTYQIAVDGFNGDSGDVRLAVAPPVSPRTSLDRTLELGLTGQPGVTFAIEASTNLTSWTTLTNLVIGITDARFFDLQGTNFNRRFYRAVQSP